MEVIGNATLYLGDCLEVLPKVVSADFVWTDPPYNVGMDYGTHKDDMPEEEYLAWCESWIAELRRVSSRVSIYPPKVRLRWFWERFPDNHLVICGWSPSGAVRGSWVHQYAPLLLSKPVKSMVKDHWWNVQVPGLGYFYREDTFGHPGRTSDEITQKVLDGCSNANETVLDPFMGTGTTGVACEQMGRTFVGIEIHKPYFEIACQRIENAQRQAKMFA